jgi:hypothetical protein
MVAVTDIHPALFHFVGNLSMSGLRRDLYLSALDDDIQRRKAAASVFRRGPGAGANRVVAEGRLESMIEWIVGGLNGDRRNFVLVKDGMEYQPAEVENLARQFGISVRPVVPAK